MEKQNRKSNRVVRVVIIVAIVVALGLLGYLAYAQFYPSDQAIEEQVEEAVDSKTKKKEPVTESQEVSTDSQEADSTSDQTTPEGQDELTLVQLVKELNKAGAELYGSKTCGYCQQQKEVLGDQVDKITYYEYSENPEIFAEKGIQYFPTWIISGKKHVGFQSLDQLRAIVK